MGDSMQMKTGSLQAGNARFVAGRSAAPNRDIERLREVAPRQTPPSRFGKT